MRYLSKSQLAVLVIAVVYLVSPVDLVPEVVLGPLGLTDDAAALTVIISGLLLARSKAKEKAPNLAAQPVPVQQSA